MIQAQPNPEEPTQSLEELLQPKSHRDVQAYRAALDAHVSQMPKDSRGRNTYARYENCLLKAANIIAICWEKLPDELDDVIRNPSKPLAEQASDREIKIGMLKITQAIRDASRKGLLTERPPEITPPRVDVGALTDALATSAAKLGYQQGQKMAEKLKKAAANASFSADIKALISSRKIAQEMTPEDYIIAQKQIQEISKGIAGLKISLREHLEASAGNKEVRAIVIALDRAAADFANQTAAFLPQTRSRK